jgi:hypothetical protein
MQNSIIKIIVSVIISLGLSSISAAISVYQYFTLHLYMQQRQQYKYKKVGKRRSILFLKYLLLRLRYRGGHIWSQLPSGISLPDIPDDSVTGLRSAGSAVTTSSKLANWTITNSNLAIDSVTSDKIVNNRSITDNDTRRGEDISSSKIDSSSDLYF